MLKKLLLAAVGLLAAAAPAAGASYDAPAGKWWERPRVAQAIGLTAAEKTGIENAYVKSQLLRIDLRAAVQKEKFELDNLLDNEPVDEPAAAAQFAKLLGARDALAREQFQFLLAVRKKIGSKRFEQLRNVIKEMNAARKKKSTGTAQQSTPAPKPKKAPAPQQGRRLVH